MGGGKGFGKGGGGSASSASGTKGGTQAVPQAQRGLTRVGRTWAFIRPWWRDIEDGDPEFQEMVGALEDFWTACEERIHNLRGTFDADTPGMTLSMAAMQGVS